MALLNVDSLKVHFHTRDGIVRAVDNISYQLEAGETLGIVGESGSGKSVSCYALLGLVPTPPGQVSANHINFDGVDLLNAKLSTLQKIRGKRISMIFQDPMTCLNPYLTVGKQLMEPLFIHEKLSKAEAKQRAIQALDEVGILEAEKRLKHYPHEFSGGMRQRVMIAMALITSPDLLIADEPTTALDVTVQAQVLELIKNLRRKKNTSVIFITHDLGVIADMADKVMVMYAGKVLEQAATDEIFYQPKHPYTSALLDSIPAKHERGERLFTIPGVPPDLSKQNAGCPFAPRCDRSVERCSNTPTELLPITHHHFSSCLRVQQSESL